MKKLFSKEVIIGITVVLSIVILYYGIEFFKGVNIFRESNRYYASFTNVEGLATSAPVNLNGYKVGQVRDIQYEYDNPGHVKVTLGLDKELQLPEGTKACVVSSLLGTASISLELGPTNGKILEAGATLEGAQTPGMLDAVSNDVLPAVTSLVPKIDTLLTSVNRLVSTPEIYSSLESLDRIMSSVETTTTLLNSGLEFFPHITQGADATVGKVQELATNLSKISAALAALSDDMKQAPIKNTLENLNQISANLDKATRKLMSKDNTVGLLLNDPNLYNHINKAAAQIDSILMDLKCHPKRYIPSIKIF